MHGVGRVMGVLDRVLIVEGQGAVLGVNLGRPTVTALFSIYFEDFVPVVSRKHICKNQYSIDAYIRAYI